MTNTDEILEYLEESYNVICDDCLTYEANIFPRQQVNQICRRLAGSGLALRQVSICSFCNKEKLTNTIATHRPRYLHSDIDSDIDEEPIDIGKVRTTIVKICKSLWIENMKTDFPHGLSRSISLLRDATVLPGHQSNMMLTLCHLRNHYVYEDLEIGENELRVAKAAWAIVDKWWKSLSS